MRRGAGEWTWIRETLVHSSSAENRGPRGRAVATGARTDPEATATADPHAPEEPRDAADGRQPVTRRRTPKAAARFRVWTLALVSPDRLAALDRTANEDAANMSAGFRDRCGQEVG